MDTLLIFSVCECCIFSKSLSDKVGAGTGKEKNGWILCLKRAKHHMQRQVILASMMLPCIIASYSCFLDYSAKSVSSRARFFLLSRRKGKSVAWTVIFIMNNR